MRILLITTSIVSSLIIATPIPQNTEGHEASINQVVGGFEVSKPLTLDLKPKVFAQAKLPTPKPKTPQNQPTQATGINRCPELRAKLSSLGVPSNQLDAAITLAQRESGCRDSAVNSSSGACGVFQSLPCGKWGSPGTDQYLRGAINYANSRYGGYNGALAHSHANGWY